MCAIARSNLIVLLMLFVTSGIHAQEKVFSIDKLQDPEFDGFMASKKVIVVGEMHGTAEVPDFVYQLTRHLKKKYPVTVALEINEDFQSDIERYMRTGDDQILKQCGFFNTAFKDGRSSIAITELIKGLRSLSISVVCFDIDTATNRNPTINRDSIMALNLGRSIHEGKLVVLTGNLHANLKEGFWKPGFRSACWRLSADKNLGETIVSLNSYFGGGTMWNCMNDGCREREAFGNPALEQHYKLKKFTVLSQVIRPDGYHGFVYFDQAHASLPLNP